MILILRPQVIHLPTVRGTLCASSRGLFGAQTARWSSTSTATTASTTATAPTPAQQQFNQTPLEFLSNLTSQGLQRGERFAQQALSCTTDTTHTLQTTPTTTTNTNTNNGQTLQTTHIPFEVKTKEKSNVLKKEQSIYAPYIQLTKPRLTALVVLSAICSYALTPLQATVPQLLFLTMGTALCSSSANAINQGREPEFDKLMVRTVSRPIVRGLITTQQAYQFAAVSGLLGVSVLGLGVNSTVALLGGANIVLYGWIYTSLKRTHVVNTWVGAVVGALPPLMGWAASSPLDDPGAWCLAALLFAWQMPHFNALSHNIRNEYKSAGYVMAAHVNPRLNARVGLRYSLLMFPICAGLAFYGVTDWVFPLDSALLNGWMSYWAFKFWYQQRINYTHNTTPSAEGMKLANMYAKKTFWASVWHLPGVLILAILHKKGRWDWLFGSDDVLKA